MVSLSLALLLGISSVVFAATVVYDFEFTWINVAPDGFMRPVTAINGQFPGPTIYCTVGDRVIVNAVNNLGNTSASIHFHGLYQNGSTAQDGVSGVSQCPIPPGQNNTQTYDFMVDQPGTYWYHSHFSGQYPDGLRAPFIINDPNSPYKDNYTEEIVLTLSDWYHNQISELIPYYLNNTLNPRGPEPIPYSALMNDTQDLKIHVKPGTTYFLRIINMACFSQIFLQFEEHILTIIEMDGIYTQPKVVDSLLLATAQRYGVLLTTKGTTSCKPTKNYAVQAMLDERAYDGYGTPSFPPEVNPIVKGWLVYDEKLPLPDPKNITLDEFDLLTVNDFYILPYDEMPLLKNPTQTFVIDASFFLQDGQNRAGFNDITWLDQDVPTLFSAMTTGKSARDNMTYGTNGNVLVLNHGAVVELVINNFDNGPHPFHIHGHAPQIVARQSNASYVPPNKGRKGGRLPPKPNPDCHMPAANQLGYTSNEALLPIVPMRRDTWMLAPLGYTVLRFVADNPGVWFLHCHMDWHLAAGLAVTIVEAPLVLQKQQSIPAAFKQQCLDQGMPIAGNAAGNTQNYTDLTGEITVCPPLGPYLLPQPPI